MESSRELALGTAESPEHGALTGIYGISLSCPTAQLPFPAPPFSWVKPRDLQQPEAALGPGSTIPSCQELLSLCALTGAAQLWVCSHILARASPKPQGRAIHPLPGPTMLQLGLFLLGTGGRRNAQLSEEQGRGRRLWKERAALFLGGTGCRKQKVKLSLGSARPPSRQQNTFWFCSITIITDPSWSSLE